MNYLLKKIIKNKKDFVFLETLKKDKQNSKNLLFIDPVKVLTFKQGDDFGLFFKEINDFINSGYYVAGYFSYEFGYCIEEIFEGLIKNNKSNLVCLGVYKDVIEIPVKEVFSRSLSTSSIKNIKLNISKQRYLNDIAKVKQYLTAGDVYQINYTCKLLFDFCGDYLELYSDLKESQPVSYAGIIKMNNDCILSLSPELFFSVKNKEIVVKPMKGTIKRGKNNIEDNINIECLKNDIKNQSENVMIVDLMRNDISKICKKGTVNVDSLYEIEKYNTLFQMVSNVNGKLKQNITIEDIFKAVYPSGSVTGAPKIRAMQIINELEKNQRGVYTGAIGYFAPNGDVKFNVAIRTLELNGNKGEMGIGSGIVIDSEAEKEYEECFLKANFLMDKHKDFKLIETILWNKRYFLLKAHLQRLFDSAEYFGFVFNRSVVKGELKKQVGKFSVGIKYKIRLLLSKSGEIEIFTEKIKIDKKKEEKICFSSILIDSSNVFLYHKTTQRETYNKEYKKAKAEGFYDILFFNENNEVTEGAISNVFIEKNGILYTPPIECGLLKGVYRKKMMNKRNVIEKILYKKDIFEADNVFLCNSVRGLQKIKQ